MIGLFFEVIPLEGHASRYFELAAVLRPELERSGGVLFIDRYTSADRPDVILSHQWWADEEALIRWRAHTQHRAIQRAGREQHFKDYRLRIGPAVDASRLPQRLAAFGFSIMMLSRRGRPAASCSRAFTGKENFLSCPSSRLACRTRRQIARPSRSLATTRCMSALKLRRSIRRSCAIPRDSCIGTHDSLAGRLTRISTRPDARREIPHNRLHVMVHMDNKVLPAIKYRYPIHEVVT